MNSLKLVSLHIDDFKINFKNGVNYIVGNSNSGKTTIFNCIRFSLGLAKSFFHENISIIKLNVCVNEVYLEFTREVGSVYLSVCVSGVVHKFRALSQDLDDFLRDVLSPDYIYQNNTESVFRILDFCFLSEEVTKNRRHQWDAVNSICGINISLLKSVEKDINALNKDVQKNKELEKHIDEFASLLIDSVSNREKVSKLVGDVESTKQVFFSDFREKEQLLVNVSNKLDEIKERLDFELKSKLYEIEEAFFSLNQYAGFERSFFDELEMFIKDRSKNMSYGEETFSRFILVLAVAKVSRDNCYNFPQLIVNDSYLSIGLDRVTYEITPAIIDDLLAESKELQYLEFTHRDLAPTKDVVLNLNGLGGVHVFNN